MNSIQGPSLPVESNCALAYRTTTNGNNRARNGLSSTVHNGMIAINRVNFMIKLLNIEKHRQCDK